MELLSQMKSQGKMTHMTYQVLKTVIEKKEKQLLLKRVCAIWGLLVLSITLMSLYQLFFQEAVVKTLDQAFHIAGTGFGTMLFFTLIFGGLVWKVLNDKYNKADDEYDKLRKEIIDRSDDLWYQHLGWDYRADVCQYLKETYDINLYHK